MSASPTDATPTAPSLLLEMSWDGGTHLVGRSAGVEQRLDWEGEDAFSPVQSLAMALAGCMGSDLVTILQKGRLPVRSLRAVLAAVRSPFEPRRLLSVDLRFLVTGDVPADRVERALALSREKYCSVWHSMRTDIAFTTSFEMSA